MNRDYYHFAVGTLPRAIACVVLLAGGLGVAAARADIVHHYSFDAATQNSSLVNRTAVANQLLVTVSAPSESSGYANFTFRNLVGFASNVSEIRFDGGASISTMLVEAQSGASFGSDRVVTDFVPMFAPSPNLQDFGFGAAGAATTRLSITDDNGLNAFSDWLTVRVTFTGMTFADVMSAMANPYDSAWFRIGVQVQSIGDDAQSDGFFNGSAQYGLAIVPLPLAFWPGLATIGGAMGLGIYRRRAARA